MKLPSSLKLLAQNLLRARSPKLPSVVEAATTIAKNEPFTTTEARVKCLPKTKWFALQTGK